MTDNSQTPSDDNERASFVGMSLDAACIRLSELAKEKAETLPNRTRFRIKSTHFEARIVTDTPDHPHLIISACLGYLPYTAEDEWTRRSVFELAREASQKLPAEVKIDRKNRVWLEQTTVLDQKPKTDELNTLLAQMALHVTPLINSLDGKIIPISGDDTV